LTEEQENKEKRKNTPLTKEEYLTFFFFPHNSYTEERDGTEIRRFKKYGFKTKLAQAKQARILGHIFYCILMITIIYLAKHYNIL
jgi:hypothetical protein